MMRMSKSILKNRSAVNDVAEVGAFHTGIQWMRIRWPVKDITIIFFLLKLSRDKFKLSRDNFELSRDNLSVYRAINCNISHEKEKLERCMHVCIHYLDVDPFFIILRRSNSLTFKSAQ